MRNHLMWPGDLGNTNVRLMQVQFFIKKKIEWGGKKSKETFKLEHNESKLEIRLRHIQQERPWLPLMLLTV